MKRTLLVDGRLAWPAVSAFVFLCASVVVFDLCWRLLTVSFEALTIAGAVLVVAGLAVIAVLARSRGTRQ